MTERVVMLPWAEMSSAMRGHGKESRSGSGLIQIFGHTAGCPPSQNRQRHQATRANHRHHKPSRADKRYEPSSAGNSPEQS